ncbi:hypothetical protein E2C01_091222 [Portunus trituberculatus]|uniref:Uncharacterized protein n=1 Tax=Portunus trituberculatus TaxID=210409 RepID=A0A5B7JME7_PORTR|nr:hypothetical protein [Portunus trituberculatus]
MEGRREIGRAGRQEGGRQREKGRIDENKTRRKCRFFSLLLDFLLPSPPGRLTFQRGVDASCPVKRRRDDKKGGEEMLWTADKVGGERVMRSGKRRSREN